MDKFYEQFLTTQKSILYKFINILMYVFAIGAAAYLLLSLIALNMYIMVLALLSAALFFVMMYIRDRQYKEYEYIFTNGNFQIDVIFNKKKRKTLIDEDIKNFDEFGKAEDVKLSNSIRKINCMPWNNKKDIYVFVLNGKEKSAVYIAPDEEMLKLINLYYIRRVKR